MLATISLNIKFEILSFTRFRDVVGAQKLKKWVT